MPCFWATEGTGAGPRILISFAFRLHLLLLEISYRYFRPGQANLAFVANHYCNIIFLGVVFDEQENSYSK